MNIRKTLLALAAAAAAAPAAFAGTFVGGEIGYDPQPVQSTESRAQVREDAKAFRAHPVLADGTVALQGEAGYVPANQGTFADQQPSRPHTHVLGNSGDTLAKAVPSPMTDAERRAYSEQYIN